MSKHGSSANEGGGLSFEDVVPLGDSLGVDWETEEEDWTHHLIAVIDERTGFGGLSVALRWGAPDAPPYYEVDAPPGAGLPSVRLYRTEQGVIPAIDKGCSVDDRDLWRSILREATRRTGGGHVGLPWAAYVAADNGLDLADDLQLGELALQPHHASYEERSSDHQSPHIWAGRVKISYPVRVEGTATAVDWNVGQRLACNDLYRACVVLSVLTGAYWRLLHYPHFPATELQRPPEGSPMLKRFSSFGPRQSEDRAPAPRQIDRAWTRAIRPDLVGPLSAYYRALRIVDSDLATTLALLTAAIEGVGTAISPKGGAKERFRVGLRTTQDEESVKRLAAFYGRRSDVAHGQTTEGQLLSFGHGTGGGMFSVDAGLLLTGEVWRLRNVARDVLLHVLTADDPGMASPS